MSLELTEEDRRNPLWLRLERHLTERLAFLRKENDASREHAQTEHQRGRIAEIKAILALADEKPRVPPPA